jgi:tRNA-dihydrouridine synthase 1
MESNRKVDPYTFWESIGRPQKVVAPMVDHCDLAYRMQTRKYGADLVYTQMYNANAFVTSKELRESLTTCEGDRPLFVQLAGHDPEMLLKAAKFVEHKCDAVDLNLGCPQGIAKRGRYGAFLMDEVDLLVDIVSTMVKGLSIPVTCKVRIYKDYDRTIQLCEALVGAGASLLTVHGRTREEKGQLVREPDWATIARIKQHFANRSPPVPVIANGGIECLADVQRCIDATGADGVMTSEGILENPALFTASLDPTNGNIRRTQLEMAEEYLQYCAKYPVHHMKCVRSHLMKMLYRYTCRHIELRDLLGMATTLPAYMGVCSRVRELIQEAGKRDGDDAYYQCSWYMRYRQGLETNEDGEETVVQKAVIDTKDKMLDLSTSFIHAGGQWENNGEEEEGEGENCGGGIFSSLFG